MLFSIAGSLTVGNKLKKQISTLIDQFNLWEDDLYAYSYWCNDMATGLSLLKREFPDIHCISRAHGYDVYLERNPYNYLPLKKFVYSTLDQIFFVSAHGRDYTVDRFGSFPSFQVQYLGVHAVKPLIENIRDRSWNLISCSSIISIKRIEIIIEALSLFTATRIHWTHIGDGDCFNKIESYGNKLLRNKSDITYNLLGQMSNCDILQMYASNEFDLFINVSKSEGLPVSMMEAMGNGIPVLGPDVGGIGEIVKDKVNGVLISDFLDAPRLKKALDDFFRLSIKKRQDMSTNARRTWEGRFQASSNYPRFIDQIFRGKS